VFALLEGVVVIVAQAFACGPVDHLEDAAGEEGHYRYHAIVFGGSITKKSVDAASVCRIHGFSLLWGIWNRVMLSAHSQKWLCHC
jgi:hypothetical protein